MTTTHNDLKREFYDRVRNERDLVDFLLADAFDGVWYLNLQERQEWVSPRLKRALGYSIQELSDAPDWWRAHLVAEDLQHIYAALEDYGNSEREYDQVLRGRHKNGATLWFRCRGLLLRDHDGRPNRLLGAITNITALQAAERKGDAEPTSPDSDAHFRRLTDAVPQLLWTCDASGGCEYVNQQWLKYTGVTYRESMSDCWLAQVHPDDRSSVLTEWDAATRAGAEFSMELRLRRHDGVYRWFDTRAVELTNGGGPAWVVSSTDVTERRLADEAAQQSHASIETVISNMSEGLVICDVDGHVLRWNPAGVAMYGFRDLEEGKRNLPAMMELFEITDLDGQLVPFEDWPLNRVRKGETVRGLEVRFRRRDMDWERVFSCNGSMVSLPDGTRLAFVTLTDLTERDRAVRALANNEQRLRVANEVAGIGTYELDYATNEMDISPELCAIAGVPPGTKLELAKALTMVHPEDRARIKQSGVLAARERPANELRVIRPDGEVRWLSWSSRVLVEQGPAGTIRTKAVGACLDVTQQRVSQRRLTTHNAVNRVLADATELSEATPLIMQAICEAEDLDFGSIWQVDETAGVLRCVDVWYRPELPLEALAAHTRTLQFRRGDALPGRVWELGTPLLLENVDTDPNYVRSVFAREHSLCRALAFPIIARGQVTGVVDFLGSSVHGPAAKLLETVAPLGHQLGAFFERKRAEAERRELEKQLQQAQKMEALGQLSGGIAHDFNNVLTAILSNAEIAMLDAPRDSSLHENLRAIEEASHRAKNLVWQILAFARQQPQARRVISLAPHVEESVRLLRATIPAGVELVVASDDDVPDVLADGTQLQQVFLNLVTNAWHSIEGGRGRVVLSLSSASSEVTHAVPGLGPGHFARVSVQDTGQGMPAAVLDRIFEPFFTTKEPGRGTGLGLSVVHGIVRNHEGAIQVTSTLGQGTRVDVYLPAARQTVPSIPSLQLRSADGSGQNILYIDDEQALVTIAERTLGRLGYHVVGFTSPEGAIQQFAQTPDAYALVATDLNMPSLSGVQVAAQVRAIRPDVPILLLSGHISDELRAAATDVGVRHFLYKPYRIKELGDAVGAALEPFEEPVPA